MKILIIDAQGGGIGRQLISALRKECPTAEITAVGTNCTATAAMLKAGADRGATGENAVIVCSRTADMIVGPIGIVIADSLLGEITPAMATAVGQSCAKRILIPMSRCDNIVAGTRELGMGRLIQDAVQEISMLIR